MTAVVASLNELIKRIQSDYKYLLKLAESLSFNVFNFNDVQAGKAAMGLNGQFVYNQVLMNVLLRLTYADKDKEELINLCKTQYSGNMIELKIVKEFELNYTAENALWWYTRECFLYKILNKALRVQDIHVLFLLRSVCRDIYQQLKKIQCNTRIKVYRGQVVSAEEITSLASSDNQLISINSFFSTSFKQEQALKYLSNNHISSDLERVLFEIEADPNVVTTKPFANISSCSAFGDEAEVLFMYGSIFRLQSIQKNANNLWTIRMSLCGENESGLKSVLEHMKTEYSNKTANLHLLGTVLWRMGNFGLAKKYFLRMISEIPFNDPLHADLYKDLGEIAAMTGDLDGSVQWKKKALEFKEQAAHNSAGKTIR